MAGRLFTIARWRVVAAAATIAVISTVGLVPSEVLAHDDIASSSPESRSTIDDPIDTVEIDFGEEIGDDVKMFLTYDVGNNEIEDIGGDTVKTGATTARIDFELIDREGTYFVQYLAPVPSDGHVIAGAISFTWGAPTAILDSANPDIRTSTPGSLEVVDEPITFAEIHFELEITDDVTLQLVYDNGDGENFTDLGGVTTKTGPQTATLDFDALPKKGTYFITYDTTSVLSGDEIVGATSFVWGQPSGTESSSFPWLIFIPIAIVVLGIGAWFSYRQMLVPADEEEPAAGSV
jgi:methionine-rich copper-binding protein CopC